MPIKEPGLEDLFVKANVSVEDSFEKVKECDFVYIAFDTPIDKKNIPDITCIIKTIEDILPYLDNQIIIISSQLPIGTSSSILKFLRKNDKNNEICHTPENLRLGDAIHCFMYPDRMIFGLSDFKIKPNIEELFSFWHY
jgi:UDPglucose 6-dehydrogenase